MVQSKNDMGSWQQLLMKYGAATVIACFLVYRGFEMFENYIVVMARDLTESKAIMANHVSYSHELTRQLVQLSRQNCLNTAKTDDQRRGCNQ